MTCVPKYPGTQVPRYLLEYSMKCSIHTIEKFPAASGTSPFFVTTQLPLFFPPTSLSSPSLRCRRHAITFNLPYTLGALGSPSTTSDTHHTCDNGYQLCPRQPVSSLPSLGPSSRALSRLHSTGAVKRCMNPVGLHGRPEITDTHSLSFAPPQNRRRRRSPSRQPSPASCLRRHQSPHPRGQSVWRDRNPSSRPRRRCPLNGRNWEGGVRKGS